MLGRIFLSSRYFQALGVYSNSPGQSTLKWWASNIQVQNYPECASYLENGKNVNPVSVIIPVRAEVNKTVQSPVTLLSY